MNAAVQHASTIAEVPCGSIVVMGRYRKDLGDLDGLAASIAAEGLLQPIGITEDNQLVFGERRLRAIQNVLKWTAIPARVVSVRSILSGEYAENEIRKDFTVSERVAIGKALEVEIGKRQGQRTDQELSSKSNEVEPGARTGDVAAKKAGLGRSSYDEAKKVVTTGTPALVEAMDAGEVSIHAASIIANEPPERQAEIAAMPADERKQAVRDIKAALPPKVQKKLDKLIAKKIEEEKHNAASAATYEKHLEKLKDPEYAAQIEKNREALKNDGVGRIFEHESTWLGRLRMALEVLKEKSVSVDRARALVKFSHFSDAEISKLSVYLGEISK